MCKYQSYFFDNLNSFLYLMNITTKLLLNYHLVYPPQTKLIINFIVAKNNSK